MFQRRIFHRSLVLHHSSHLKAIVCIQWQNVAISNVADVYCTPYLTAKTVQAWNRSKPVCELAENGEMVGDSACSGRHAWPAITIVDVSCSLSFTRLSPFCLCESWSVVKPFSSVEPFMPMMKLGPHGNVVQGLGCGPNRQSVSRSSNWEDCVEQNPNRTSSKRSWSSTSGIIQPAVKWIDNFRLWDFASAIPSCTCISTSFVMIWWPVLGTGQGYSEVNGELLRGDVGRRRNFWTPTVGLGLGTQKWDLKSWAGDP